MPNVICGSVVKRCSVQFECAFMISIIHSEDFHQILSSLMNLAQRPLNKPPTWAFVLPMRVNSWTGCLQVPSLFQDVNGAQPRPTEQSQGSFPDIRNDTQSGPISALSTHQKHDFTNAELKINHLISICWWLPQKNVKKQIPSRLSGEEMTPATLYVEESLTVITGTERMKLLKQTPMVLN